MGGAGAIYDRIGAGYDSTRHPDLRIAAALVRHLRPAPGRPHLDMACGTGNYAVELARCGIALVGVDRSSLMLDAARRKSSPVQWCQADVAALPFSAGTFAGAVSTLALHHFADLEGVVREVWRVLAMAAGPCRARACVGLTPSTPARHRDTSVRLGTGVFGPEEYGNVDRDPERQPTMPDLDREERQVALESLGTESRLARGERKAGVVECSVVYGERPNPRRLVL